MPWISGATTNRGWANSRRASAISSSGTRAIAAMGARPEAERAASRCLLARRLAVENRGHDFVADLDAAPRRLAAADLEHGLGGLVAGEDLLRFRPGIGQQ